MDSVLRDIDRERSKMQSDIENMNRHYGKLCDYVQQYTRQMTIEWAKLVADHPQALLLVMETTRIVNEQGYAYGGESEPIRLTALALASGEIWDQLLRPTHSQGVQGSEYHGLRLPGLVDKPRLADAWPDIAKALEGRHVVIFGADFARSALQSVLHTHVLDDACCLHNRCKEYYSQFYELSLERVLAYQGIDKKREQLTDSRERVLVLGQVVCNLAAGMAKQTQEDDLEPDDLDSHLF